MKDQKRNRRRQELKYRSVKIYDAANSGLDAAGGVQPSAIPDPDKSGFEYLYFLLHQ